jgi:hypothetical protein
MLTILIGSVYIVLKHFFFKSIFLCTPKLDVENITVSIIEYIITIIVINFIRITVLESTSLFLDSKIMWFVTSTSLCLTQ